MEFSFFNKTCIGIAWTSPDGKPRNQIDHILVDKRRHSNVLDALSYRAADCDTDHSLVVAKFRVRINKDHTDFIRRGPISRK
jgi:endonuclease/exonuclease/phosphatase family metal-dependent hydrolase